jgi:hypothetical protein
MPRAIASGVELMGGSLTSRRRRTVASKYRLRAGTLSVRVVAAQAHCWVLRERVFDLDPHRAASHFAKA